MVTWNSSIPNCGRIQSKGFLDSLGDPHAWVPGSKLGGVYLFVAPPGVGALDTAKSLAKLSACLGTKDQSCACRHCISGASSCADIRIATLNQHGNLLSASVEGLDRFFSSYPVSGACRKVLIVESVEKATATTASSLLKILEGTVQVPDLAIFTTSRPHLVSPPLLSRMEQVLFSGLGVTESRDRFGASQAGLDLSRSQRWLSQHSPEPYLSARKALPSVLLGVQASSVSRAWRALHPCLLSQDAARATTEVLLLAFTDMLSFCGGQEIPMPGATVLSSLKDDYTSYASTWGTSHLVSLADDLRNILSSVVAGRDMRTVMYRWVVKAASLTAGKNFVKAEVSPTSVKLAGREPAVVEDDIIIDFG